MNDELVIELREALEALEERIGVGPDNPELLATRAMLRFTLSAAESGGGIGECRRDEPYAPLRPVMEPDGTFKWCCTHSPEHCS